MEFKRRQFKEGDLVTLENNRRNWRIYNMPTELINWYISYAKLYCDNQVWKVLELGKELIEKKKLKLEEKILELEKRIEILEEMVGKKEEEVRTFGGEVVE